MRDRPIRPLRPVSAGLGIVSSEAMENIHPATGPRDTLSALKNAAGS
jgi:hypothetical protein